jgi:trk system potassium uptake protein TrkH
MIRWPFILHILGSLMVCIGLCMLLPIGFSLYYWDGSALPLLCSAAITAGLGLVLYMTFRRNRVKGTISHREGMAITTLGWVAASIFGGLPFYLSGVLPQVVDCIFETTSGFTTTGASVIRNVEIVAPGILFWRSLTHWLGGLGIIVLGLAILPFLGVGGMQLYKAEVPGPVVDKLKPRLKDTAMILWKVYVFFTVAETILLLFGGMNLLDALCHTFGTLATGGFSTKNTSIGYYHSVYIDIVVTVFMLLGGINFALHFQFFRGKPLAMWRDSEFRFFLGFWLILTLVITFNCYGSLYASFWKSLQYASFTVASITTTTGYSTANFELWPSLSLCLLLLCMVVGASVGSTGGAVKCMRIMVVLKHGYRELIRLIHPRAVVRLKMGDQAVAPEVFDGIAGFIFLYVGLAALSMFLVASAGVDLVTTFSAVLACIGNVGPGLGKVGPMDNYADVPALAKWILTLDMLLGRLEIYTVIILLVPRFYKK